VVGSLWRGQDQSTYRWYYPLRTLADVGNALKKMTDIEDVGMTVAWMVECKSLTAQNICVDAGIGL
jgi:hypothetical protein